MKITFLPDGRVWEGNPGARLMDIAAEAGYTLDGSCGGRGSCRKCKVLLAGDEMLACLCSPIADMTVTIPSGNALIDRKSALTFLPDDFAIDNPFSGDARADEPAVGCAFDIGTTTVVGLLWDMREGRLIDVMSESNPQTVRGADVISRITFAAEAPGNLDILHRMIALCADKIADTLLARNAIPRASLKSVAVCGNTTMSHIFARRDPTGLAIAPFHPAYEGALSGDSDAFGLSPGSAFYLLPGIAGHVGSDITADILALEDRFAGETAMLIDIGTNGEIFLIHEGRMQACSTAAGPAFEGVAVRHGMRAAAGAIEKVWTENGAIRVKVIGDAEPVGICGSGIIDAMAVLLETGIVNQSGRMKTAEALIADGVDEGLAKRVRHNGETQEFVLHFSKGGSDIVFTQKDVREVQLAKGAIATGAELLLRNAGIAGDRLAKLFIAGAFGNHIDLANALRIGVIPPVAAEKVVFVGNTAAVGASMALLSAATRRKAEAVVADIEHLELAADEHFQDVYMNSMLFGSLA